MCLRNIFLVYFLLQIKTQINCKSDFCSLEHNVCHGEPHIACSGFCPANDNFCNSHLGQCTNLQMIPMSDTIKNLILTEHNKYRNEIAGGRLPGFPSAGKMLKVYWDDELQYLSQKHVEQCYFEHDKCRSTDKFAYAGQNIAIRMSTNPKPPPTEDEIMKSITAWWDEYKLVNPASVQNLIENYQFDSKTGHFFVMIRENQPSIGCAIAIYSTGKFQYNFLFTCNYAETNMMNERVYTVGSPCSECCGPDLKCDSKYQALCGNSSQASQAGASQRMKRPWEVLLSVFISYFLAIILTT